ncbi:MAG: putative metal-binding motif-containing protein [Nitrospirae bacterium]|nr:putative metal-binding motif-containing protein [Nitrospirota bacterium]
MKKTTLKNILALSVIVLLFLITVAVYAATYSSLTIYPVASNGSTRVKNAFNGNETPVMYMRVNFSTESTSTPMSFNGKIVTEWKSPSNDIYTKEQSVSYSDSGYYYYNGYKDYWLSLDSWNDKKESGVWNITGKLYEGDSTLRDTEATYFSVFLLDADGDGFPEDLDCNDNDRTVYPGATETCNNKDDDCDGLTDENLTRETFCGVGECARSSIEVCSSGSWGNVCTPGSPSTEVCDNKDNDCDGKTDEDLTCQTGGEIKACYNKVSGALRIVQDASHCTPREKQISWNQNGLPLSEAVTNYRIYDLINSTYVTIGDLAGSNFDNSDHQITTTSAGRILASAQVHIDNPGGVAVRGACEMLISDGTGPTNGLTPMGRPAVWFTTSNSAYELTVTLVGSAVKPASEYNVVVQCEQLSASGSTGAMLDNMIVWQAAE